MIKVLCLAIVTTLAITSARELQAAPGPAPGPGGPTYTVPNWRNGVKIDNTSLPVGGTLSIPWVGKHGVYQTASFACPASFATPNPNGLVAGPASGGSFNTTFDKAGKYYFVCQVGDHCSEGQMIAITVA